VNALVALYCHGKDGNVWKGSGNIIHPKGYILTNRHVAADAEYCEVAIPKEGAKLPARNEVADLDLNPYFEISGWRPYTAVNYFVPSQEGLSDDEKFVLDFAVMKINSVNDGCQVYDSCKSLPTTFPYNPVSNWYVPTSTAGQFFPINLGNLKFTITRLPNELLMYGYPGKNNWDGQSHTLRGNLGYAIAYLPGDKKFSGYPITMLARVLYSTYGGASGSGVFYKGHIVGLTFAAFNEISVAQSIVPMPFISMILNENGKGWVLDPTSKGDN
jgi:hypothetical protein